MSGAMGGKYHTDTLALNLAKRDNLLDAIVNSLSRTWLVGARNKSFVVTSLTLQSAKITTLGHKKETHSPKMTYQPPPITKCRAQCGGQKGDAGGGGRKLEKKDSLANQRGRVHHPAAGPGR